MRNHYVFPILLLIILFLFALSSVSFAGIDDSLLTGYIRTMRSKHPDLQAMRSMIDAERSRTAMNSGWMNPSFTVGAMNVPYPDLKMNADPMTMLQFGLMQRIPFPGRTSLQRKVGEAKSATLQADLKVEELTMSGMLRMAYYDLAAALATKTILDSGVALLQEMRGSAVAMTGAAMGSSADIYSVDAEMAEWSRKISDNDALISKRRATLAAYLGTAQPDTLKIELLPATLPTNDKLNSINLADASGTPQLVAAKKKVDQSNSALSLARKSYYPDFDVMLQYGYRFPLKTTTTVEMVGMLPTTSTTSTYLDPMVSAGISFPLPIWAKSNQKANISEMTAMLESAKRKYEAARIEWQRELSNERADYEQVAHSVTALRNEIIPARSKAWSATMIGYRSGGTTLMAVSEARMKLLMAKMEERMLMAESWARSGNLLERIEP